MTGCTIQRISRELKKNWANLKLRTEIGVRDWEIAHLRPEISPSQQIFISAPENLQASTTKSDLFRIVTIGRNEVEILPSSRVYSPAQIIENGENFCLYFSEMTGTQWHGIAFTSSQDDGWRRCSRQTKGCSNAGAGEVNDNVSWTVWLVWCSAAGSTVTL